MSKLHLYKRTGESPYWHAQVYIGGNRYRFSCRTDDKRTAREYARQKTEELQARHNRGLIGLPEPIRVSEVFERYEKEYASRLRASSRERMIQVIEYARSWLVDGPPNDPVVQHVTPQHIAVLLERKRGDGVSARTVNLHRANLHRVFQLCVRPWLLIATNPVAATEPLIQELREPQAPTLDEYKRLRNECHDPMLHLFVTLAWELGARTGELLQLEWADVDFERKLVTFRNDPTRGRQTKGRRSRTVPVSELASRALREHAASFRLLVPQTPWVFKHVRSSRTAKAGQRIKRVYRGLKAAAKRAAIAEFRPHDLRHAFVTRKIGRRLPC